MALCWAEWRRLAWWLQRVPVGPLDGGWDEELTVRAASAAGQAILEGSRLEVLRASQVPRLLRTLQKGFPSG